MLGTAFSVGCQVDGRSPKAISDDIKSGEIEGMPFPVCSSDMGWLVRVLLTKEWEQCLRNRLKSERQTSLRIFFMSQD
jgi:hypothetical protein